ncbi:hypothetical protein MRX96_056283 [Rhipicephalus microplus]
MSVRCSSKKPQNVYAKREHRLTSLAYKDRGRRRWRWRQRACLVHRGRLGRDPRLGRQEAAPAHVDRASEEREKGGPKTSEMTGRACEILRRSLSLLVVALTPPGDTATCATLRSPYLRNNSCMRADAEDG